MKKSRHLANDPGLQGRIALDQGQCLKSVSGIKTGQDVLIRAKHLIENQCKPKRPIYFIFVFQAIFTQ